MTTITTELYGHTITIDDKDMRFQVTGPIITDWFNSYQGAENAITSAAAKHEAQTRRRISIVVLDEKGNQQTITGVHAGNGKVLGLLNNSPFSRIDYYPNVPWIAESIKRAQQLRKEFIAEQKRLEPFKMISTGHDLVGATHAEKVDALVALVEAKTKAAAEQGG